MKPMDKIKDATGKWGPLAAVLLNLLVLLVIIPVVSDTRTHTQELATIKETLKNEPKVHELLSEQTKGWTREQLGAILAEIQRELKEIRKEIRMLP